MIILGFAIKKMYLFWRKLISMKPLEALEGLPTFGGASPWLGGAHPSFGGGLLCFGGIEISKHLWLYSLPQMWEAGVPHLGETVQSQISTPPKHRRPPPKWRTCSPKWGKPFKGLWRLHQKKFLSKWVHFLNCKAEEDHVKLKSGWFCPLNDLRLCYKVTLVHFKAFIPTSDETSFVRCWKCLGFTGVGTVPLLGRPPGTLLQVRLGEDNKIN